MKMQRAAPWLARRSRGTMFCRLPQTRGAGKLPQLIPKHRMLQAR
ncbi:hypothetical protein BRADI_3g25298v3 [Brachypodium distachyon]|uniref:Uncharacterized protein n=1 Tax=Brachypodium distachyon TaxID=15368 RepID=A0A2K2CZ89_BRADI|nr:hypothetical protein BRADI_3g25298v3 [Brachypodium distachyon]